VHGVKAAWFLIFLHLMQVHGQPTAQTALPWWKNSINLLERRLCEP